MSLDDLYREIWTLLDADELSELDAAPPPRGPEVIYRLVDRLELGPERRILDLACGPGEQAAALVLRYGIRVVAIDPVVAQLAEARRRQPDAIAVAAGRMESVALAAGSIDLVWLRDALIHTDEPEATLGECFRVVRPGGHLLLHTAYATLKLAQEELELLTADMRVRGAGLDRERVERAWAEAGFEAVESIDLGSELAEHYELQDGLVRRACLRLARLEREPELWRERLGEQRFRTARAVYCWIVFEVLGKLSYRTDLLRKPAGESG